MLEQRDYSQLFSELEYYRNRCSELESLAESQQNKIIQNEARIRQLEDELQSVKTTLSAVVAKSIDARPAVRRHRSKRPGQKKGHVGNSRKRPEHVDAKVIVDQTSCHKCGSVLSERPTDSYKRVLLQTSYLRSPWLQNTPSTEGTAPPAKNRWLLQYRVYSQTRCSGSG